MTKQARLTLGLDIRPLQEASKEAKRTLEEVGNVRLDKQVQRAFKSSIIKDVNEQIKIYKSYVSDIQIELAGMAKAGEKAFSSQRANQLISTLAKVKREVKSLEGSMSSMSGDPAPGKAGGGGGGVPGLGGMRGGGRMGGMLGRAGPVGIAASVAMGAGMWAMSRAHPQAMAGMGVREITGGGLVDDNSRFGFNRMERRGTARGIGAQLGRDASSGELNKLTDQSEMMQRAFGISGGQFAGAVGSARKAGIGDQGEFVATAVGDAVAIGLTGSAVGEYLGAMTGYLDSMSKGINVDQKSLKGFASSLGSLDFFKSNPERIFDTLQGLQSAFRDKDPFQEYLTYQSFQEASGGKLTPAGVEIRRNLPLIGSALSAKDTKEMRNEGLGAVADIFNTSGKKAVESRYKLAERNSRGKDEQNKFFAFLRAMGLENDKSGAGLALYRKMRKNDGNLPEGALTDYQDAIKTPEERAAKNMATFEGGVIDFATKIDNMKNLVSDPLAKAAIGFVDGVAQLGGIVTGFERAVDALPGVDLYGSDAKLLLKHADKGWDKSLEERGLPALSKNKDTRVEQLKEFDSAKADIEYKRKSLIDQWEGPNSGGIYGSRKGLERKGITQETIDRMKGSKISQDDIVRYVQNQKKNASMAGGLTSEGQAAAEDIAISENVFDAAGDMQSDVPTDDGSNPFSLLPEGFSEGGGVYSAHQNKQIARMKKNTRAMRQKRGGASGKSWLRKWWDSWSIKSNSDTLSGGLTKHAKKTINRARGGPVGSDTVSAWLTPGEYVNNRASTAKNFGALAYANAGGSIGPIGDGANGGYDSPSMDFSGVMLATSANTSAIRELTAMLAAINTRPSSQMRDFPRGDYGVRYG